MGDGTLPPEHTKRLSAIGGWMSRNSESVKGTSAGLEPYQFYGPTTQKGNTIYLHLLMKPYETVTLRNVHVNKVESVRTLRKGTDLNYSKHLGANDQIMEGLGFTDPLGDLIIETPKSVLDDYATVIVVNFKAAQ
jgi:alpha-L-fucosidase